MTSARLSVYAALLCATPALAQNVPTADPNGRPHHLVTGGQENYTLTPDIRGENIIGIHIVGNGIDYISGGKPYLYSLDKHCSLDHIGAKVVISDVGASFVCGDGSQPQPTIGNVSKELPRGSADCSLSTIWAANTTSNGNQRDYNFTATMSTICISRTGSRNPPTVEGLNLTSTDLDFTGLAANFEGNRPEIRTTLDYTHFAP